MNKRKKVLVAAISVFSVFSVVTVVVATSANAQGSRQKPESDSAALAVVARYLKATFLERTQPEFTHWIDELQLGDGPVARTEVFMARPNRLAVRVTIAGQVIQDFGYDGTTGWTFTPATGVTTVAGRQLEAMRADIRNPLGAEPVASDLRFISGGKVEFEGEFTDLVFAIDARGDTTENYYAVSSGLLSAMRTRPAKGRNGSTILYRDYRPFSGEQVATTKTTLLATGSRMVTRMVHMSTDPIPEERFRRPTAPPQE